MMQNSGLTSATSAERQALEISQPQPVWQTLDEARERSFTGEIVFDLEPEVVAYLDYGVVYYAERSGDVSLGQRLLEAGLLDDAQLRRGAVRVGEVEHLGRLFDRDPSVERDPIVVATERFTEELLSELANSASAAARATAYRHHPSGIHRWFVAPAVGSSSIPIGDVGHLAPSAVDELPGLPVGSSELLSDELYIEWDIRLDVDDELGLGTIGFVDEVAPADPLGVAEPSIDVDHPQPGADDFVLDMDVYIDDVVETDPVLDADPDIDPGIEADAVLETGLVPVDVPTADVADEIDAQAGPVASDVVVDDEPDTDGEHLIEEFEFEVTWPEGSAAETTETAETVDDGEEDEPTPPVEAQIVETDDGGFHFEMPPLVIDEPGTARGSTVSDDSVPDDVADAVRRALSAIETATAQSVSSARIEAPIDVLFDDDVNVTTETSPSVSAAPAQPDAEPPSFSSFAPPTPDMRAEVLYAQAETSADGTPSSTPEGAEQRGTADGDRSSALKRLIGSLRRKDR